MSSALHPGLLLMLAGALLPVLGARAGRLLAVLAPLFLLPLILLLEEGSRVHWQLAGLFTLEPFRVDALGRLFLIVFAFTAFAGALFACRGARRLELAASSIYAGAAMGAVLAADLITLFVFWECMALAAVVIIWANPSPQAWRAGMRYALIHLLGGVVLMLGIAGHAAQGLGLGVQDLSLDSPGGWLILCGFLLNAGAPPLSAWVADAYPEASFSGMVTLSAFTTKTAVYVLLRGFPGTELLLWAGLIMVFYGIIYALLENDMRRILAYSIVNQVGFMLCGIGIGTSMALNGAAAHAFTHIIYKALLLMSAGSVLLMTGKRKCTDLGGLVQSMPFTALCGIIGGLAISSFPLTSGFISKSMVTQASADEQMLWLWLALQAASAGVFLHAGIKFPWFVFFQKDSGLRPPEPSWNMCLAMGLLAFSCLALGAAPGVLYQWLPYPVHYQPYSAEHVLAQLQLLLFAGLAFFLMLPWMQRTLTISLDFDWLYRRALPDSLRYTGRLLAGPGQRLQTLAQGAGAGALRALARLPGPGGISGNMTVLLLLFALCLIGYLLLGRWLGRWPG